MFIGSGTVFNAITIALGALLGRYLGRHIPERFTQTATWTLGLITFFLALRMMMEVPGGYALHVVAALVFGAILGEAMKLEQGLEALGRWLKDRVAARAAGGEGNGASHRFVEGFVVASLIYCIGPMTLLGTFEDGAGQVPLLLYIKGTMDGVLAVALATRYGLGVLFSALFVLVFQGLLTAAAWLGAPSMPELWVQAIGTAGGVMVLSIGFVLLDIKRIRVANLIPALPLVCLLLWLWPKEIG